MQNQAEVVNLREFSMDDIEVIKESLGEVKENMKEMSKSLSQLVRVEERVASLLKISEENTKQINKQWDHIDTINKSLGEYNAESRVNTAIGQQNSKFILMFISGIVAICVTIIGTAIAL